MQRRDTARRTTGGGDTGRGGQVLGILRASPGHALEAPRLEREREREGAIVVVVFLGSVCRSAMKGRKKSCGYYLAESIDIAEATWQ
jgi:hypothetical protein